MPNLYVSAMNLPLEIFFHIFSFLQLKDLLISRRVCKGWNDVYGLLKCSDPVRKISSKNITDEERLKLILKHKIYVLSPKLYNTVIINLMNTTWLFLYNRKFFYKSDKLKVFLVGWKNTTKDEKKILITEMPEQFRYYLTTLNIEKGKPNSARLKEIRDFILSLGYDVYGCATFMPDD